jgi:glycosyltransferase involved in cell wall biosynthesis
MKILFSITYFSPYNSGLTNYVRTLADELHTTGKYRIKVLCIKHNNLLPQEEIISGYTIVRAKPLFKLSKGFISIDWLLKSVRETLWADVLVVNLPQVEGLATAVLARLFGKKIISIYHAGVQLRGGFADKIIQNLLETVNYLTMALSHKVVAYTRDYALNNRELLRFKSKTDWVYPPVRTPGINWKTEQGISRRIPKGCTLVVGMAARLAEDKGFEYMIEGLPILERKFGKNKVAVLVAGPLDPVGEKLYRRKILKMLESVKHNFIFLGEIANETIGSFYKKIDVLAVPSILESFGIVQVEAMMVGVPVVTSNLPGARVPINRTGMGYLIPSKNSRALADAIIKAAALKDKCHGLIKMARKEFSINKTIKYFEQLFERL